MTEIKIEMISRSERREQIEKKKKSLNMLRNSIKGDAISRLEKKKKTTLLQHLHVFP